MKATAQDCRSFLSLHHFLAYGVPMAFIYYVSLTLAKGVSDRTAIEAGILLASGYMGSFLAMQEARLLIRGLRISDSDSEEDEESHVGLRLFFHVFVGANVLIAAGMTLVVVMPDFYKTSILWVVAGSVMLLVEALLVIAAFLLPERDRGYELSDIARLPRHFLGA